jgi:hypothetical protein
VPVEGCGRGVRKPRDPGLFQTLRAVDESVENLCCTWGERWKITRM